MRARGDENADGLVTLLLVLLTAGQAQSMYRHSFSTPSTMRLGGWGGGRDGGGDVESE